MIVVGFEKVRYTSKKTGREVEGFRFHCNDEDSRNLNLTGISVVSEFVSDEVGRQLLRNFTKDDEILGANIAFRYNRFGRVDEIDLID